ncbi:putative plastid-lipid-associated protein 2, chloroplastic [Ananas comosus]|uniref:Putative plastid-lipid-associated protein 2, chloroplastic n=1 Tax=Ananas comosus TaxID=4615 RepID=A0A199USD4_ANACO|nr:putative plastid-lipid-associated protein 2, chloroplastic [Ananas comosus]
MAGAASWNSLALKSPPAVPASQRRGRRPSAAAPGVVAATGGRQPFSSPVPLLTSRPKTRRDLPFRLRAAAGDEDYEDEWGKEGAAAEESAVAVAEGEEKAGEVGELKKKLKELLYGTDRGLKASSETRAEILELITQLEAKNPTPEPTDALPLLNGKWILAYTSFSQLFPLLGSGRLPPLVKVEEISQTIDSENFTVQNSVQFTGPLATTSVSTNAKFEVRSPKRVQIKFEEGIIGTPQLTDSIVIPDKVEFLGQNIDLSPFKGIFTSIQNAASSVAKTISGQPPLKIPISNSNAQSWLLTTYLDDELRISRVMVTVCSCSSRKEARF